eukprot:Plantae.Rhodophyta-Palmaria_palmata.ctg1853.p1 GENE.Plantae.Rhodophyta-Palmaria_palmata.ctg1853~~Plantae.Rhodophyta-Palmaria_palmata.ctg1853.p1  ORF type:complete len:130 (+),score=8.60 Plantae.Rhodophyta-Palmaria_palmata.ctg1853:147-536(+)
MESGHRQTEVRQSKGMTNSKEKNAPRVAPVVNHKNAHFTMNYANEKAINWFRNECPAAMEYMQKIGETQESESFPPCVDGNATRAPFKHDDQNRYALLDAMYSDTTGPISPPEADGNKYIQIMVDACKG